MSAAKSIKKLIPFQPKHWVGDGFHVHPSFGPYAFSKELSPFLMCDYGAPKHFPATNKRLGVGQHPHRGFETVTIAYQGEVEHADSTGATDVIGTGDVQWMTAGRGIIHQEFHSTKLAQTGGTFEMIQLWVNLPKKFKMQKPGYQALLNADMPRVPLPGRDSINSGYIKVIAGQVNGSKGPATTHTPIELWDVVIANKGDTASFEVPAGHNTILFARKEGATFIGPNAKETEIAPQQIALLNADGTSITVRAPADDTQLFLMSGEPIDEPIAARGPFVMNTQAELQKANEDFYAGRMGK